MSAASEINLEVEHERSGLTTTLDNEVEKEREVGDADAELNASSAVSTSTVSTEKSKRTIKSCSTVPIKKVKKDS